MKWGKRLFAWLRCRPWTGITISVSCVALIILRNIFPQLFAMDAVSVGLLVVAVAPWLRSAIKSIELAGIGKIELTDVEQVAVEVGASDLPSPVESPVATEAAESGNAAGETLPEAGVEESNSDGDADPEPDAPVVNAHLPRESFNQWLTSIGEKGGWMADGRGQSMSVLDIESSLLSTRKRMQVQIERVRETMLHYLRLLCQIYGIAPIGLSAEGMLKRLQSRSAVTEKQAGGIAAAIEMVDSVLHTPTAPRAMQRTLDVAKEVNESLVVLVRQGEIVRLARDRNSSAHGDGDHQAS